MAFFNKKYGWFSQILPILYHSEIVISIEFSKKISNFIITSEKSFNFKNKPVFSNRIKPKF